MFDLWLSIRINILGQEGSFAMKLGNNLIETIHPILNKGYSFFLLNMAFISSSEVENILFHEWRSHE